MSGSTDVREGTERLAWLRAWRRGVLVAAAAAPATSAAGALDPVPAGIALGAALALAGAAQRAVAGRLASGVLTETAAASERACRRAARARVRRHRRLAAWLRRTAAFRAPARYDVVPQRRVVLARHELLDLADDIEAAAGGDARIWADVESLLGDAIDSPLLNEALSEEELGIALRSLRYRVATDPRTRHAAGAGDRSVNDTGWSLERARPRLRSRHERHGDAGRQPGAARRRRRARA